MARNPSRGGGSYAPRVQIAPLHVRNSTRRAHIASADQPIAPKISRQWAEREICGLVQTDAQLARVAAQLQTNPKVLETKILYVCFQRSTKGEAAQRALNAGLRKLRIAAPS